MKSNQNGCLLHLLLHACDVVEAAETVCRCSHDSTKERNAADSIRDMRQTLETSAGVTGDGDPTSSNPEPEDTSHENSSNTQCGVNSAVTMEPAGTSVPCHSGVASAPRDISRVYGSLPPLYQPLSLAASAPSDTCASLL